MDEIEKEIGVDRGDLIELALLLGSDYTEGINGLRESEKVFTTFIFLKRDWDDKWNGNYFYISKRIWRPPSF